MPIRPEKRVKTERASTVEQRQVRIDLGDSLKTLSDNLKAEGKDKESFDAKVLSKFAKCSRFGRVINDTFLLINAVSEDQKNTLLTNHKQSVDKIKSISDIKKVK